MTTPAYIAAPGLVLLAVTASGTRYLSHRVVMALERDYTKDSRRANIALLFNSALIFRQIIVLTIFSVAGLVLSTLSTLAIISVAALVYWFLRHEILIIGKAGAELGRGIVEGRSRLLIGNDVIIASAMLIVFSFSLKEGYFDHTVKGFVLYYVFALRQMLGAVQGIVGGIQKLALVARGVVDNDMTSG